MDRVMRSTLWTLVALVALVGPAWGRGCPSRTAVLRAVHHAYADAHAVVVGTVLASEPWEVVERRDAPTHTRRFRLAVDEVVRGVWIDDEVELEVGRERADLDLAVGVEVLCFLDRDGERRPRLVGCAHLPSIAVGSRQVLAYRVALRTLDEVLGMRAGSPRQRALIEWVVTSAEREPTRAMGLRDLTRGAFDPDRPAVIQQLDDGQERRIAALLASGALTDPQEDDLLRVIERECTAGPWVPELRAALAASLHAQPLADPERSWSVADQRLLMRRLDLLALQRRLAGLDGRRWPERRAELRAKLGDRDVSAPTPLGDPEAAAALVAEVLGPTAPAAPASSPAGAGAPARR